MERHELQPIDFALVAQGQPPLSVSPAAGMRTPMAFCGRWHCSVFSVTAGYTSAALSALVGYEYLITISQEVDSVWRRQFSLTSVLLISTRWVMLVNQIFQWLPASPHNCHWIAIVSDVPMLLSFAQVAIFSALRVYAIGDRNVPLLMIVLALGLIPLCTNIFGVTRDATIYVPPPINECASYAQISDEVNTMLLFLTRGAAVAADILVLLVTWLKTYRQWRQSRQADVKLSVSTCLLRDGTWYFVMLLALNVAQMATFRVEAAPVSILVSSLPSVLISRFMLNLRHASRPPSDRTTAASLTEMSFPDFRAPSTFTGNIGEPLDYGEEDSVTFAPWDGDDLGDEQRLDGESANDTNASPVESSVAC